MQDNRAFVEARHAWNAVEMGDELVDADLEQISIGCNRRGIADGLLVPSQLLTPLADLGVGEVCANLVRELVPDFPDKSQVRRNDCANKP